VVQVVPLLLVLFDESQFRGTTTGAESMQVMTCVCATVSSVTFATVLPAPFLRA
jgi:hypothetical protein